MLPSDDYLTTIARKSEIAVLPSVFKRFSGMFEIYGKPGETLQVLKTQHFIRMRLRKLRPSALSVETIAHVKARRKLKCMSLRLAFAYTSCTPMTIVYLWVKQLR